MKKKTIFLTVLLLMCSHINPVFAFENTIDRYYEIIEKINNEYNTSYRIVTEDEFKEIELFKNKYVNYEEYIQSIINQDPDLFEKTLVEHANKNILYEIDEKIIINTKSSNGTKSVLFNDNVNKMTLKYKYSGSKFDTSYKPSVTVEKVANINYFVMSSYTGSFKNFNKTYSVVAKGKIIMTIGIVNDKSFTVNFNL